MVTKLSSEADRNAKGKVKGGGGIGDEFGNEFVNNVSGTVIITRAPTDKVMIPLL